MAAKAEDSHLYVGLHPHHARCYCCGLLKFPMVISDVCDRRRRGALNASAKNAKLKKKSRFIVSNKLFIINLQNLLTNLGIVCEM